MYDIKSLEDNWNRYNNNRRKRLFSLILIFLLLIATGVYFLYNKNIILKKSTDTFIKIAVDAKSSTKTTAKQEDVNSTYNVKVKKVIPKPIVILNDNPMEDSDVFLDNDNLEKKKRTSKKIHFQMVDANSPIASQEIEHRFTISPNIDDSIFLANMYYKKGSYSKAAYWSLQTNKLNSNIEESWLIFADSKSKIGQKNEAIRVLSEYINKSNSIKAKKLLIKLKQ